MADILQDFEDHVKEIETYMKALEAFHEDNAQIHLPSKQREADRFAPISADLTAIMKANMFLMLYNLVEWSIREGILLIYQEIEVGAYSYEVVRQEIKTIWTKFQYRQSFDMTSSWETYYEKAVALIQHAIEKKILKMDRKAIPVSGNLDADQIRLICELHGIKKNVPPAAKGGAGLSAVKVQRNLLAHGSLGFSECGRQFQIEQIRQIKSETVVFTRGILRNIVEYLKNKKYLHA